jgi:ketosteroid isomerase-like protein
MPAERLVFCGKLGRQPCNDRLCGDVGNSEDGFTVDAVGMALLSSYELSANPFALGTGTMTRQLIWCLLVAGAGLAQNSHITSESQEGKLLALENMWNQAQLHRDAGALEALIADRFVNTEYDGEVSDRNQFLADIKDPQFKPSAVSLQDVKVNIYRETAVVTGLYRTKGSFDGKPYDHLGRFTDTWILENGRWECVASHTSLLKK